MKTLILVRHSKTKNRDGSITDFDRPLTKEGIFDSSNMAKFLLESGIRPDIIITSSASRALETAQLFAEVFNYDKEEIIASRKLYYCSAKTILDQVFGLPPSVNCVMVVAHNPGISDLSRGLSSGKTICMDNTQVSVLKYEMEHWYQVDDQKPLIFSTHTPYEIIS